MILVIGEALIDLIGHGGPNYEAVVGGANANVALALAVRGEKQAFLGRISKDGFGRLIYSHLSDHGVNLDYAIEADEQTSLAVATIDEAGVASYSFYINGTADWGWQDHELPQLAKIKELGTKVIQFGCLGMAIEPGSLVIENWLSEIHGDSAVTLSHDLNIRPAIGFTRERELERVLRINSLSHIIKASDADVAWLYGESSPDKLEEIYTTWSREKLLVITKGGEGSTIYCQGDKRDVPALPTKVVDTVGAGDTFMANLLGELLALDALGDEPDRRLRATSMEDIQRAAQFASAASSIVCERVGCNPPTLAEVRARLRD